MNDLAVRVEHLHKRYRLGVTHAQDGSLAGALSRGMRRLVGRRSTPPTADDTLWA
ncbi:MAG: ABC transporter ATP-binding protein, partial [Nitrospira sp.]|nr:ABC transporter ATP-binding protein [Nitrospira sp.]